MKEYIMNNKTVVLVIIAGSLMMISVFIQSVYLYIFGLILWTIPIGLIAHDIKRMVNQ